MDAGFVTAWAALAGAALGGMTSFAASWISERARTTAKENAAEKLRKQELYKDFVLEVSRVYGDALVHDRLELPNLTRLYGLISRMRCLCSETVIEQALAVVHAITDIYNQRKKTPAELDAMIKSGSGEVLHAFCEICRKELGSDPSF